MHIDGSLWIDKDEKGFLGKGRIELLRQIDVHGSLSKAAKAMKMSYKAAWDSLNEMKSISKEELIISNIGGAGGGGSTLTQHARNYIKIYELLFKTQQEFLKNIEIYTDDLEDLKSFLQRNSLRTSARNQLFGKITAIKKGKINSLLLISISKQLTIKASITNESISELGIENGKNIYALIKASWVKIVVQEKEENLVEGIIESIKRSEDLVEISLKINDSLSIISVMNNADFDALHVKETSKACASFKPHDIIIGV